MVVGLNPTGVAITQKNMKLTLKQRDFLKKEVARCNKKALAKEAPFISYAARREACSLMLDLDDIEKVNEGIAIDPSEQI